ncbi:MAG: hypothetical protein P1S46_12065 [bacterium]|nr:hypothetical protein [bacterium]MDT8396871.1 hypothetical protein [bacterium]
MTRLSTRICTLAAVLCLAAAPAHAGSPVPAAKNGHYVSNIQYTGGTGTGHTLAQIRWGDHRKFERIVLEFAGDPTGDDLPRMKVETEYYPMRLAIRLPGAPERGVSLFTDPAPFRKSSLITRVDTFDVCGGGQLLSVVPARPVEFEIFTMTNPPRLVIDIILSRMDPMREETKYSMRTLPLYGDQVCILLDEAANVGITPRLITDANGNIFGELGLYDEADKAFASAARLGETIGKQFTLQVKARGMMEAPAALP